MLLDVLDSTSSSLGTQLRRSEKEEKSGGMALNQSSNREKSEASKTGADESSEPKEAPEMFVLW